MRPPGARPASTRPSRCVHRQGERRRDCTRSNGRGPAACYHSGMLSAPEAYRLDLGARGEPFSSADGDWIIVATALSHATLCPAREQRQLVREADELARAAFGAGGLRRRARAEWGTAPRKVDALILLALAIQEAGANNLAL